MRERKTETVLNIISNTHSISPYNTRRLCVPDDPILSSTPERVGPHGGGGNALHSVSVIREHVDGLLHRHVVNVNLRICSSGHQDPLSRVWQELHVERLQIPFTLTHPSKKTALFNFLSSHTKVLRLLHHTAAANQRGGQVTTMDFYCNPMLTLLSK